MENKYYKVSTGMFTYYQNILTGATKVTLGPNDEVVSRKLDDFIRVDNL